MADPVWPDSLPAPSVSGYGYKPVASFVRTSLDSGQSRQRRRFISTPTQVTVQFRLSRAQLATFETWWSQEAKAGSAWCQYPLAGSSGVTRIRARATDIYSVADIDGTNGHFDISFPLETLSFPVS